jgi:hypothetical protein
VAKPKPGRITREERITRETRARLGARVRIQTPEEALTVVLVRDDRLTALALWLALPLRGRWLRLRGFGQDLRGSACTSLSSTCQGGGTVRGRDGANAHQPRPRRPSHRHRRSRHKIHPQRGAREGISVVRASAGGCRHVPPAAPPAHRQRRTRCSISPTSGVNQDRQAGPAQGASYRVQRARTPARHHVSAGWRPKKAAWTLSVAMTPRMRLRVRRRCLKLSH